MCSRCVCPTRQHVVNIERDTHQDSASMILLTLRIWVGLVSMWVLSYGETHTKILRMRPDSCHTYEWVLSDMCTLSYVEAHQDSTCVTWLVSYMWVSLVGYVYTCRVMCGDTRTDLCHDVCVCVTWRIHICGMTHSHVWHDAASHGMTRRIHTCDTMHLHVWNNTFIRVTWRIHICDRRIHMFDMIHSYGVATISRLLKMIILFCKRAL